MHFIVGYFAKFAHSRRGTDRINFGPQHGAKRVRRVALPSRLGAVCEVGFSLGVWECHPTTGRARDLLTLVALVTLVVSRLWMLV